MTPAQVNAYCGKPYKLGAMGPNEFDCRGLMVHIERTYYAHNLPNLPDGEAMRSMYAKRLESGIWQLVDTPKDGDGAILRGGDMPHVGVYLELTPTEKGVIHSLEGVGVIFTHKHRLRTLGFSRVQYIRFFEGPH